MKKKTNKIIVLGLALFTIFAFTSTVKAQATYSKFVNNLSCAVQIKVDIFTNTNGPCNVCNTLQNVSVPANSSTLLNYGVCNNVCNVRVTLFDINGVAIYYWVDFSATGPVNVGPAGCAPSSAQLGYTPYPTLPGGGWFILNP